MVIEAWRLPRYGGIQKPAEAVFANRAIPMPSIASCASFTAWSSQGREVFWFTPPARFAEGKPFCFPVVSGAGKTTISRLAPPDATLLTDEISYVRREGNQYIACGTPFAGELARVGENCSAPLSAFFLLEKGLQNRIEPIGPSEAIRRLLRNILFFADDPELVKLVFQSACEFASLVPIHRLVFVPDQRVWDIIR